MNPEIKSRWVAALRSGDYPQGTGALNSDGHFCWLGVLCDLAVKAGVATAVEIPDRGTRYFNLEGDDATDAVLNDAVIFWAGLKGENHSNPWIDSRDLDLAEINDAGATFAEIADLIEAEL